LKELGKEVFGDTKFDAVKTAIGIVATRWMIERPMIFKASIAQAHGRSNTGQMSRPANRSIEVDW
jgi:hypothetical protein